jgi:hypothetical protein
MLERTFDLSALAPLRHRMLVVEPPAVDPSVRADRAFRRLGDRLARRLIAEGRDFVLASVRLQVPDGGRAVAAMHAAAFARAASPEDLRVRPLRPLALDGLVPALRAPAAPDLKGWLRLGAWICGAPGWDDDAPCVEIPLLLPLSRLRSRPARRFLATAA